MKYGLIDDKKVIQIRKILLNFFEFKNNKALQLLFPEFIELKNFMAKGVYSVYTLKVIHFYASIFYINYLSNRNNIIQELRMKKKIQRSLNPFDSKMFSLFLFSSKMILQILITNFIVQNNKDPLFKFALSNLFYFIKLKNYMCSKLLNYREVYCIIYIDILKKRDRRAMVIHKPSFYQNKEYLPIIEIIRSPINKFKEYFADSMNNFKLLFIKLDLDFDKALLEIKRCDVANYKIKIEPIIHFENIVYTKILEIVFRDFEKNVKFE